MSRASSQRRASARAVTFGSLAGAVRRALDDDEDQTPEAVMPGVTRRGRYVMPDAAWNDLDRNREALAAYVLDAQARQDAWFAEMLYLYPEDP